MSWGAIILLFFFSSLNSCTLQPQEPTLYPSIKKNNRFVVKGVVTSIRKIGAAHVNGSTTGPVGGLAGSIDQSKSRVVTLARKLSGKYNGVDRKGRLFSIKNEYALGESIRNFRSTPKNYDIYEVSINLDNGKRIKILMKNLHNIHLAARVIVER